MTPGRLVCPYCYESFRAWQILFRCTGRKGRAGIACKRERDPVLAERMGRSEALPPVFKGNWLRASAPCPQCGDMTPHRVCPVCHSDLPLHFARIGSRLIATVGAKESGKTVFMTVLVHELTHRVGERFEASVVGCDDTTRRRFESEYERRLYRDGALAATTPSAATMAGGAAPLVFRFSTQRDGLLGRARISRSLLSFFDTAGEDLTTQESVQVNARYLASADGIVVLLDPLQMEGGRRLAATGTRLPSLVPGDGAFHVLSRVTDLLQGTPGGRASGRIRKPTAVAFSKIDALWHRFGQGSPLRRQLDEAPAFDTTDSLQVDEEVKALLHELAS